MPDILGFTRRIYLLLRIISEIIRIFAGNMKQIEVVAAIIHDGDGRIFATQRGYGDYKDGWEFPGGKMEAWETPAPSGFKSGGRSKKEDG